VARLKLEPQTRKIVRKPFGDTDDINIGFVVVELLKEDGAIVRIRALW
jgi:hypothetical protein